MLEKSKNHGYQRNDQGSEQCFGMGVLLDTFSAGSLALVGDSPKELSGDV